MLPKNVDTIWPLPPPPPQASSSTLPPFLFRWWRHLRAVTRGYYTYIHAVTVFRSKKILLWVSWRWKIYFHLEIKYKILITFSCITSVLDFKKSYNPHQTMLLQYFDTGGLPTPLVFREYGVGPDKGSTRSQICDHMFYWDDGPRHRGKDRQSLPTQTNEGMVAFHPVWSGRTINFGRTEIFNSYSGFYPDFKNRCRKLQLGHSTWNRQGSFHMKSTCFSIIIQ